MPTDFKRKMKIYFGYNCLIPILGFKFKINFFYHKNNYEYNNKKAIIKENNPVASARAKPKIA